MHMFAYVWSYSHRTEMCFHDVYEWKFIVYKHPMLFHTHYKIFHSDRNHKLPNIFLYVCIYFIHIFIRTPLVYHAHMLGLSQAYMLLALTGRYARFACSMAVVIEYIGFHFIRILNLEVIMNQAFMHLVWKRLEVRISRLTFTLKSFVSLIKRKKYAHSLASFRLILNRIKKSFFPNDSLASM